MLMQGRFHHYEGYTLGKVSNEWVIFHLSTANHYVQANINIVVR